MQLLASIIIFCIQKVVRPECTKYVAYKYFWIYSSQFPATTSRATICSYPQTLSRKTNVFFNGLLNSTSALVAT